VKWLAFVERHGVVLASARGPVPSVAEAIAGAPIRGSWWSHPKRKAIFRALAELDDSPDVLTFKLVAGKVSLAHRRVWPALVRLAEDGVLDADQVAAIRQEHTKSGKHVSVVTPFPKWVDAATRAAAARLTVADARALLPWL
jgi:hypothetical protein